MLRLGLLALLAAPLAHAQSSFNLPSIPTSTAEASTARAATLLPTGDPTDLTLNPASLGSASGLLLSRTGSGGWLGIENIHPRSLAVSYGTGLEAAGQPLSVGVGLIADEFAFNDIAVTSSDPSDPTNVEETYDAVESALGFGLGVRWEGPARVAAGVAAYRRQSPELTFADGEVDRDRATTLDLGAMIELPLLRGATQAGEIGVPFSLVAGATRRHVPLSTDLVNRELESGGGSTIEYRGVAPTPETVLGGGTRLAVEQRTRAGSFTIASLDSRVEREWVDQSQFTGGPEIAGNDLDGVRLAVELAVLETLVFRSGVLYPDTDQQSDRIGLGASLRVDGLLRAIGTLGGDARLGAIGERLTLRADLASYEIVELRGSFEATRYAGFSIGWRP